MNIAQLLATAEAQISASTPLRNMRNIEKPTLMSGESLCVLHTKEIRHTQPQPTEELEIQCSACSAPRLVPLDAAWIEGKRYRLAGAHEVVSRLPLFIQDDHGDTRRAHGVLIRDQLPPPSNFFASYL